MSSGSLLGPPSHQLIEDQAGDGADRHRRGVLRQILAAVEPAPRIEIRGEAGDGIPVPLACLGAGRRHLDQRGPRQLGLTREDLHQRGEPLANPGKPGLLPFAFGDDRGEDPLDHPVVGREKAVVLVLEVLVEGRPGGARLLDHVCDRRRVVALAADDADHRGEDAVAAAFELICHGRRGAELETRLSRHDSALCTTWFIPSRPPRRRQRARGRGPGRRRGPPGGDRAADRPARPRSRRRPGR